MKTAIKKICFVLLLLSVFVANSFAQMREPKQIPLKYNSIDTVTFHSSDNIFKATNQFVIGFHWNNEANAAAAVLANSNNIFQLELFEGTTPRKRKIQNGALLFIQDVKQDIKGNWLYRTFSHAVADDAILNTHSMTWKPNMLVDSVYKPKELIAMRPNDTTNPVFGFMQRNGLVPGSGANYNFLLLPNTGFINSTVFSKPWGSEYLKRVNTEIKTSNHDIARDYWGYTYLVSVKIKRTGNNWFGVSPGANVLEIKIPYLLNKKIAPKDSIKFDGLPSNSFETMVSTMGQNRGRQIAIVDVTTPATSFFVTENMIPNTNEVITVTARFRCWGLKDRDDPGPVGFRNPRLLPFGGQDSLEIKKLGITAIYRGGCPCAVGEISILSPHTKSLYEGAFDAQICTNVQENIDITNSYNNNTAIQDSARIFRFTDVTEGDVQTGVLNDM